MSNTERFHASLLDLNRVVRGGGFPGESAEVGGWLLTDSGTRIAALNLAFVLDPVAAISSLPLVESWFEGRSNGFVAMLRDPTDAATVAAAKRRGYSLHRSQPLMAVRLPLSVFQHPAGFTVRPVRTASDIRDYLSVRALGSTQSNRSPDGAEGEFITAALETGRFKYFVARRDGSPVGTASSAAVGGVVHVSNVLVAPGARRIGLGASMTARVASAFPGTEWAALEASAMGEPVYRRMGFVERYRYVRALPATSESSSLPRYSNAESFTEM